MPWWMARALGKRAWHSFIRLEAGALVRIRLGSSEDDEMTQAGSSCTFKSMSYLLSIDEEIDKQLTITGGFRDRSRWLQHINSSQVGATICLPREGMEYGSNSGEVNRRRSGGVYVSLALAAHTCTHCTMRVLSAGGDGLWSVQLMQI